MGKRESYILTALAFSAGIVFGFLISPVKNGIGNNSGNCVNNYYDKKHLTGDNLSDASKIK